MKKTIIEKAVKILKKEGYKIIQYFEPNSKCSIDPNETMTIGPCIYFEGEEFDLIKTYELLEILGFPVTEAKRVYGKEPIYSKQDIEIGENWSKPHNELTFAI
jgi:hypothetical protein